MIGNWKAIAGAVVVAAAVSATGASAQISLGGGPTFGVGDLGDVTEMGYHAQVSLGLNIASLPVGVRLDGAWNSLKADEEMMGEAGSFRYLSGTANAIINVPLGGLQPYLIGGLGMYNGKFDHDGEEDNHEHESSTDFGVNGGAGINLALSGLGVFAEFRLHHIFGEGDSKPQFAPLTLGVRF